MTGEAVERVPQLVIRSSNKTVERKIANKQQKQQAFFILFHKLEKRIGTVQLATVLLDTKEVIMVDDSM